MALEKVVTEDKIEIVGPYKAVQIRTCTQVLEDGVELSSGYHRHVISCWSGLQRRVSRSSSDLCSGSHG
jgi:Uri superfamily endonuclease